MGFQMTLIFLWQSKQRWLDVEFLPSRMKCSAVLSSIFLHPAKQRWLDGLSPFKLDGIADDSDLLSSSQAEMA
jgi:hypothetical protein